MGIGGLMIVAGSALVAAATAASAQAPETFYRGKTITMYIGTGENAGVVGAYPHTIAQVIRKYIPGNPNVVVTNMPGAGGIKLANFIQSVAPQDGTHWAFITRGFVLAPLLKAPGAQFDPTSFAWIGSPSRSVSVGGVWTANTDVRTIEDAMRKEVVIGATAPSQDTAIFPNALNKLIGTKFKVITGYASVPAIDLALQKGELDGKVGFAYSLLTSGANANWLAEGKFKVLIQLGLEKAKDISPDVPLALDYAKSPEDRAVLEILCAPSAMGYPSFMGAGVPSDRILAIRKAYEDALKDPQFVELAARQQLDIDYVSPMEIETTVRKLYQASPAAIERVMQIAPNG
ncbi:MAG: tripartite tricarboxylate transporter family receptor [Hyphomicrobiales bacterium]|nr:tripartite tricarboxylate transporter family receptor [Hyphomicrobiales bacterium]